MTDVTGFGLFGHAMEMARGSGATVVLNAADVPLLPDVAGLVQQGFVTGASGRNWASYGDGIDLATGFPEWRRHLYTDPQTSGGLLIACEADQADAILRGVVEDGYRYARIIGRVEKGEASVRMLD
jgi:selenide,water dikinase